MELLLQRRPSTDGATLGQLYVDGAFEAFTLEDVVRDGPKVIHETAIPIGRYAVVITWSQRFQRRLPLLVDVPGFTGIRIHAGNDQHDTSGCVLVGQSQTVDSLRDSRLALAALQPKIAGALARGEECWIEIRNPGPEVLSA